MYFYINSYQNVRKVLNPPIFTVIFYLFTKLLNSPKFGIYGSKVFTALSHLQLLKCYRTFFELTNKQSYWRKEDIMQTNLSQIAQQAKYRLSINFIVSFTKTKQHEIKVRSFTAYKCIFQMVRNKLISDNSQFFIHKRSFE